jgi:crossover junction endodeoxyribonuclease RusA
MREVLVSFTLPGDPVAKGRPRVTKFGKAYTPAKTRDAEAHLRAFVQDMFLSAPVDVPVGVHAEFYCATARRTDGDNMFKLVTDALNGIVYDDDSQILEWSGRIVRKDPDPRTVVQIYTLD